MYECVYACVFMSVRVCVHVCLSFVENVHGLNACMCSVHACLCVCKPICVLYMYS